MLKTVETHAHPLERSSRKIALIEAALYVTGRPVDIPTLKSVLGFRDEDKIKALTGYLKERYQKNRSSLEVLELSDGRFVMQLRPQFVRHVKRLATRQLLTPGPMKTLSFIAFKQPVAQSYLAKVRGSLAYAHVKQLREMGIISEEKIGRTKLLRTTQNFADYFNLSHDIRIMKKQLEKIFESIKRRKTPHSETASAAK